MLLPVLLFRLSSRRQSASPSAAVLARCRARGQERVAPAAQHVARPEVGSKMSDSISQNSLEKIMGQNRRVLIFVEWPMAQWHVEMFHCS